MNQTRAYRTFRVQPGKCGCPLQMTAWLLFLIPVLLTAVLSFRNLLKPKTYGFYRLISWWCIIGLFARNYPYWFRDPFSGFQWISWILLLISLGLIIPAVYLMRHAGKPLKGREESEIFGFESTTTLIDTGLFRYIRHPMYASLLYLGWGIFFKHPDAFGFVLSLISTIALYVTARLDEKICLKYFGNAYTTYMTKTRRFIPFVW